MSWVDLFILAVVGLAALRGWFAGALRQIGGFVGFVAGFLIGVQFGPSLASRITSAGWRPVLALGFVLGAALVLSTLGELGGGMVTSMLRTVKLGLPDRVIGVGVGAVGALALCWMLAGLLASTSWGTVAGSIQRSAILSVMDRVLPPVPAVETRVQSLFRGWDFPNVFATLIPPSPATAPAGSLGPLQTNLTAPTGVVKIIAQGCSSAREGTGFYVSAHEVVTNAHVVAGATTVTAGTVSARVVLFDPQEDLAVLRVATTKPTLALSASSPTPGASGRVVGFPLDGSRTGAPAQVRGEVSGPARDIYNREVFTRTLEVVSVNVQPGNSGSPLLVKGRVAGVIVSKSVSEALTGYAIPVSVLKTDLAAVSTSPVSTQSCVS